MANTRFRLNDIDDDLVFVNRIMDNDSDAVAFFLQTYSKPLLEYIGRNVLKLMPLPVYNPRKGNGPLAEDYEEYSYGIGCYGMYYEFIAAMFKEDGMQPQWDKLGYYAENPRSRFYTYLSVITTRHFLRHHPDWDGNTTDGKPNKSGDESSYDENERLYLMLCLRLQDQDEGTVFTEQMYEELELARTMLKEKDAKVIELTCFSDLSTMEIADQMKEHFDGEPGQMKKKDVQTRISQWKNRAIVRLTNIITADKNKHLFSSLMEYARSKKF